MSMQNVRQCRVDGKYKKWNKYFKFLIHRRIKKVELFISSPTRNNETSINRSFIGDDHFIDYNMKIVRILKGKILE